MAMSSANVMKWAAVIVAAVIVATTATLVDGLDYCSQHNFHQSLNATHLQYTKEPVNREYAVLNQFKSLHCCAKGYRSIEW